MLLHPDTLGLKIIALTMLVSCIMAGIASTGLRRHDDPPKEVDKPEDSE